MPTYQYMTKRLMSLICSSIMLPTITSIFPHVNFHSQCSFQSHLFITGTFVHKIFLLICLGADQDRAGLVWYCDNLLLKTMSDIDGVGTRENSATHFWHVTVSANDDCAYNNMYAKFACGQTPNTSHVTLVVKSISRTRQRCGK